MKKHLKDYLALALGFVSLWVFTLVNPSLSGHNLAINKLAFDRSANHLAFEGALREVVLLTY